MLHDFLVANRSAVVDRCRARVAHRLAPNPVPGELENGVPALLGQIIKSTAMSQPAVAFGAARFRADSLIAASAAKHGHALLAHGFTMSQVIHDYGDVGQVVAELADETGQSLPPAAFATLHRCVDHATAEALNAFCRQRDRLLAVAGDRVQGERLARVTEELRGFVNNALLSFVAIKEGGVGLHGATSGVLERSLVGLNELVAQVLVDVRLATGAPSRRDLVAAERLIDEVRMAASFEARSRGCELTVFPVEQGLAFQGDRQMLLSTVLGLLHGALERSLPRGQVSLKARATASRVLFEVEDRGGTAPEDFSAGADFDISRQAVESMGGRLGLRDIPGLGSLVTIDLPRGALQAAPNVLQRTDPAPGNDLESSTNQRGTP